MSDVVRRGTIILDLIGGKIELPVPDLNPVLDARKKELDLIKQLEEATRRLKEAQDAAAQASDPGGGGGGGGPAPGGGGGNPVDEINEQIDAAKALEQAMKQAGEGVFRLARAMVLLGSDSDESFQKMIQGLAYVQAGFDLFKGSQQVIEALAKAEVALAAAQAAQTAAAAANTGATAANTAVTVANTAAKNAAALASAALAVATNPVTLVLVLLGSVIMAATAAWDYFTESEEEAARKMEAAAQAADILNAAMDRLYATQRSGRDLQREFMNDAEKMASLEQEYYQGIGGGRLGEDLANSAKGPGAELSNRKSAATEYSAAEKALRDQKALQEQIRDREKQGIDNQIQAINNANRLVDAAKRQLEIENDKTRAMQAQIGGLSKLQQEQLKGFRDRLLAGEDLTKGQENRFAELGGDEAERIVAARRAKRAEAAGFGSDFFKGIEGAGTGLDDASKKLKEAADALAKLTDGASAAAKIAELEASKKSIDDKFQQVIAGLEKQADELVKAIESNAKKIAELEITVAVNNASG